MDRSTSIKSIQTIDIVDVEDFQEDLDEHFTSTTVDNLIYGESLITINHASEDGESLAMHVMVYAGTDKDGNIYVFEKPNGSEAPRVRQLNPDEDQHTDYQYYNEKQ